MTEAPDIIPELDRQAEIVTREFAERTVLNVLAYSLCLVYLPWPVAISLGAINLGTEAISHLASLKPAVRRSLAGRRLILLCILAMETAYTAAAGLVWMTGDPYARAFAVGMIMATLLHLTTVRSIHLPYGLAGLSAVALTGAVFNATDWVLRGSYVGLAISFACMFGALSYTLTAMLSNNGVHRAMREEQARASRADAAKSRFLAVLGHEMRTPLNSVLALATEAERAAQDPAQRQQMALITRAARDMAAILDDASDMSTIADGRFRLSEQPVDLVAETETTLGLFRGPAEAQGQRLDLVLGDRLVRHVRLDPQRLRQCLSNLLTNAMRHAGRGTVQVTLDTKAGFTEITVQDDGPGVLPEDREQIFEPFHRGRTSGAGTGLGLAIARDLARQMGGDLRLVPSARGAAFRLSCPCLPVAPELVAPPPAPVMPQLPGKTALVVDDTAANRMVAAMLLRPSQMQVIEAAEGETALKALGQQPVDLVLLDLNMPGLGGREMLARLRALTCSNASVPVLAMTAEDPRSSPGGLEGLEGLDGILLKPVEQDRLAAELARLFRA